MDYQCELVHIIVIPLVCQNLKNVLQITYLIVDIATICRADVL